MNNQLKRVFSLVLVFIVCIVVFQLQSISYGNIPNKPSFKHHKNPGQLWNSNSLILVGSRIAGIAQSYSSRDDSQGVFASPTSAESTVSAAVESAKEVKSFQAPPIPCDSVRHQKGNNTVHVNINPPSWSELEELSRFVQGGGCYRPKTCIPDTRVALIIPYRDRESQLRTFLKHMHPFLRRQLLEYTIFVVELVPGIQFNRGALFNIGFLEAKKTQNFNCYIFHDVDLLPEDNRNNYTCSTMPRHLSAAVDVFKYRLPYPGIFGGATALKPDQFQKMNGFSNLFFGWGGEDDDFYKRVKNTNLTVVRHSMDVARYRMIRHERDTPKNPKRFRLLKSSYSRMATDGLNSVNYTVQKFELLPLYTWILVSLNHNQTIFERSNSTSPS